MKNRLMSFIKKQWLIVWCCVVAMSLIAMFASAEYELTANTMKKVVRSTSDQGKMFSSNVLVENGEAFYSPNSRLELPPESQSTGTYNVDVYLWNYSLSNIYKYYPLGIDYKITLTFTHMNGTALSAVPAGRSVSLYKDNSETPLLTLDSATAVISAKQTLGDNSAQSAEHHYVLKFSGNWDLNNDNDICVKMEAKLERNGSTATYQDLSDLSAVIGLKKTADFGSNGWEAYLAEERIGNPTFPKSGNYTWKLNNGTAGTYTQFQTALAAADFSGEVTVTVAAVGGEGNSDDNSIGTYTIVRSGEAGSYTYTYTKQGNPIGSFDAFNVIATGSGKAKITIKWNNSRLECNKNFYNSKIYAFATDEIGDPATTTNGNITTMVINADTSVTENGNRNRYDIQFYKKAEPTNWSFCNVTYTNTPTEPSDSVWLTVNVERQ